MTQNAAARPAKRKTGQEQRRTYRIERQFSSRRRPREFVRDLLRAHSGE